VLFLLDLENKKHLIVPQLMFQKYFIFKDLGRLITFDTACFLFTRVIVIWVHT